MVRGRPANAGPELQTTCVSRPPRTQNPVGSTNTSSSTKNTVASPSGADRRAIAGVDTAGLVGLSTTWRPAAVWGEPASSTSAVAPAGSDNGGVNPLDTAPGDNGNTFNGDGERPIVAVTVPSLVMTPDIPT